MLLGGALLCPVVLLLGQDMRRTNRSPNSTTESPKLFNEVLVGMVVNKQHAEPYPSLESSVCPCVQGPPLKRDTINDAVVPKANLIAATFTIPQPLQAGEVGYMKHISFLKYTDGLSSRL